MQLRSCISVGHQGTAVEDCHTKDAKREREHARRDKKCQKKAAPASCEHLSSNLTFSQDFPVYMKSAPNDNVHDKNTVKSLIVHHEAPRGIPVYICGE
jgi:hypothetical protein